MNLTAEIQGEIAQDEVTRGSEGAMKYCRMLRDGTLAFVDFMVVALLEGLVKVVDANLAVTGVQSATAYAADEADFGLMVPVGYTVMVIAAEVTINTMTDDEDMEILFMTSNTINTGTTGTAVTPVNKFGGANGPGAGSQCTAYVAFGSGGCIDISGGARAYAFWRERVEVGGAPAAGNSEGATRCSWRWVSPRDGLPAIVAGAGTVYGHVEKATADANNLHIRVEWIEMPTSWLS